MPVSVATFSTKACSCHRDNAPNCWLKPLHWTDDFGDRHDEQSMMVHESAWDEILKTLKHILYSITV